MNQIQPNYTLQHSVIYENPSASYQCPFTGFIPPASFYTPDIEQQKKTDENFIKSFKPKFNHNKSQENHVKISEGKDFLLKVIKEKKDVELSVANLNVEDENFENNYDIIKKRVNDLREKIVYFQANMKNAMKQEIKKREKKRRQIKKRKSLLKELKKKKQEDIKERNEAINKLLSERLEEVEAVKREAALKRQADSVLHDVRKKKQESKKMLNLLSALRKLRDLRSKDEEKKGGYCSKQLTETFNEVMIRFQRLWEKQMEVYKLEEKGLRIMLEETTLPHTKDSETVTNLLEWEKILFGDVSECELGKMLTAPQAHPQALAQVRADWDQFLTNEATAMASSIPLGWVLPPQLANSQWKSFCK